MATLTAKLTLTSSNISSDTLNLSVTDVLTTTTPSVGLSRTTITTADDQELVDNALSGVFYLYFKNLDATNFVILQTTASVQYARVGPGEFAFFAVNDSNGLEARADTASCNVEYAYWKKG
jgi:hypothetical protein|tara:strand:+ start:971 stop:1333 length:363 start_codon:yes stop_codon:yes gene_type:complete